MVPCLKTVTKDETKKIGKIPQKQGWPALAKAAALRITLNLDGAPIRGCTWFG
jgi:hypothetical protein